MHPPTFQTVRPVFKALNPIYEAPIKRYKCRWDNTVDPSTSGSNVYLAQVFVCLRHPTRAFACLRHSLGSDIHLAQAFSWLRHSFGSGLAPSGNSPFTAGSRGLENLLRKFTSIQTRNFRLVITGSELQRSNNVSPAWVGASWRCQKWTGFGG